MTDEQLLAIYLKKMARKSKRAGHETYNSHETHNVDVAKLRAAYEKKRAREKVNRKAERAEAAKKRRSQGPTRYIVTALVRGGIHFDYKIGVNSSFNSRHGGIEITAEDRGRLNEIALETDRILRKYVPTSQS